MLASMLGYSIGATVPPMAQLQPATVAVVSAPEVSRSTTLCWSTQNVRTPVLFGMTGVPTTA